MFKLPNNFYNNKEPYYKIPILPESKIINGYFFGGKSFLDKFPVKNSITYIFLELSEELKEGNLFKNLQRFLNLVFLETGLFTLHQEIKISNNSTFENVFLEYRDENYFFPKISFHGTARDPNHIARVVHCANMWSRLNKNNFEKFDNALNTHSLALEISQLPNPHLKYTLYMTLFLSAINQLADGSELCKEKYPICKKCGKEHTRQITSERESIENLMNELLTGESLGEGIKKYKKLYSSLRSSFLHEGKLSGKEKSGGFLFDFSYGGDLMIDQVDIVITCRQLFEQYLIKRQ
ncbi:hypothetical protein KKI22_00755 [Patescibacteria group bacterium]|nr:hypothetical protein [Patescibacteria group bacterium]